VERVAFLPFENLSDDNALDWIAAAGPRIVMDQLLGGAGGTVPIQVGALRDAYAAGAHKLVHGYFEKRRGAVQGALHFEFVVEDAETHKTLQTVAGDGAALPVFDRLAKQLDAGAHPFSTANAEAVAAWGRGDYESAVKLDQDFGAAWLGWVDARSVAGDARQASEIVQRALAQPGLKSPVDRARLELASATLRRDDPARQRALAALARFMPNDAQLLRQLANQEMNGRQFSQAAQFYQDALRIEPEEIESWNLLGYAQAFAGDLESARKSFERYGRDPAHAANALDSAGEAFFSRGKFAEAEKYFLQAHAKSSALLSGDDLLKAAYSRWLQGDLAGADQHFAQYVAFRSQQKDPVLVWRQAVWEYATGRTAAAMERLARVTGPGPAAQLASAQVNLWKDLSKLPADPAKLKPLYERTPPAVDGITRILYAAALLQAGQKDEARRLLELWPLPGLEGDPLLQSLLFPKYLELKRELN
jgi:tetratricopeptide (TPR) repeat protein